MTKLQSTSLRKGSAIVTGATHLEYVEIPLGEAPSSRKPVAIGSGATRFANVEIISGRKPDGAELDEATDDSFIVS
jgi:hypothetical protein